MIMPFPVVVPATVPDPAFPSADTVPLFVNPPLQKIRYPAGFSVTVLLTVRLVANTSRVSV